MPSFSMKNLNDKQFYKHCGTIACCPYLLPLGSVPVNQLGSPLSVLQYPTQDTDTRKVAVYPRSRPRIGAAYEQPRSADLNSVVSTDPIDCHFLFEIVWK